MTASGWFEYAKPIIREFEGLRLVPYDDLRPNVRLTKNSEIAGTLTVGYGHTGVDVRVGEKITEQQAEQYLREDMRNAERAVDQYVTAPITDRMKAALVSFTFNLGAGNLRRSTLLRKLNDKDYEGAAGEFLKWNKAKGRTLSGLTRRRQKESNLFLSGIPTDDDRVGFAEIAATKRDPSVFSGGEAKPLTKSTEIGGGIIGTITAAGAMASDIGYSVPGIVKWAPLIFLLIFAYFMYNRWRKSRKGIH